MRFWILRDGEQATVKKLLEALKECEQDDVAHRVEQIVGIELKDELDVAGAVANICVEEPKESKYNNYNSR